jgi:putative sigma-54 modulation protein
MRLELTGRQIEITPGMRRVVDGKLSRLERMLNDSAVSAQVVFSRDRIGGRADVTLHARGEKFLHGVGTGATWQLAVGQAFEKVAQQAHKIKGKWQERKKRRTKAGVAAADEAAIAAPPAPPPAAAAERLRPLTIVETTRQTVNPLSVSEASRKLGARGRLLVFRNADTMELAVLYRMPGGELMLVETDA